jgi:hypothetical protein
VAGTGDVMVAVADGCSADQGYISGWVTKLPVTECMQGRAKLGTYRQNSKNWLSSSRDYHLSDWLNGIDLHHKFPVQVILI